MRPRPGHVVKLPREEIMLSINDAVAVGSRLRLTFEDSKMTWVVEVVEPTEATKTEWYGRDAQSLEERLADAMNEGEEPEIVVARVVEKDLSKVPEDWAESPEVNEVPVHSDEQVVVYVLADGWMVEFGEFASLVTVEKLS